MEEDDYIHYPPPKIQPLDQSDVISHIPVDKYKPSDEHDPYGPKDRDTIIPYDTTHIQPDLGGHWHPQMPLPVGGDSQTGSIFPNMPNPAPIPIVPPAPAPSTPPITFPSFAPPDVLDHNPTPSSTIPFILRGVGERTVNVFENPSAFDSDIDDLIDTAYAENKAAGRIVNDEFAGQVGKKSLQQQLDEKQKSEFKFSTYVRPELRDIFTDDPEMAEIFSRTFEAHARIFARLNVLMPLADISALNEKLNLVALGDMYREMQHEGAEPMFVLSPNQRVGPLQWTRIYRALADLNMPNNPLGEPGFPPVEFIQPTIEHEWRALSSKEHGCPDIDGWTIRVMPTNREYNLRRSEHETPVVDEIFMPTIPEFLTAQAVRIIQGLPPILGKDTQTQSKNPLLLSRGITDLVVGGGYEHATKSVQIGLRGRDAHKPHPSLLRVYMGGLTGRGA